MSLPYAHIRIAEQSKLLTGRLIGQMFADQGATVFIEQCKITGDSTDDYLNRGKIAVESGALQQCETMDVIIVDGKDPVERLPGQIVIHVVAALPDDKAYGYLPDDCSDDLLNAIVGFYTDMAPTARLLEREVIYTPLPLCSVYAAVISANHIAAVLLDRETTGAGQTLYASRIAGGLAAVGALALKNQGLPKHLAAERPKPAPDSEIASEIKQLAEAAKTEPNKQLELEETLIPLGSAYDTKDGKLMFVGQPNLRLNQRLLKGLGIYQQALELGLVEVSPYLPEHLEHLGENLAQGMNLSFAKTAPLAKLIREALMPRRGCQTYDDSGTKEITMKNY